MKPMHELLPLFNHTSFRPMQEEAIQALLDKQDVLLISPTGGGKSLVYQIAAMLQDGVAIIVCPLLALMTQQVQTLKDKGIKADYLNSTLNPGEQDDLVWALRHKEIDLLFLSPEKLSQSSVLGVLSHVEIAFFAIDEAHCITQWGNDFRPEYGELACIRQNFPNIPIIAMSGTADPSTQAEIVHSLQLEQPKEFVRSFNRENIELVVSQKKSAKQQVHHFLLTEVVGWSGIIYCLSRKKVEEISDWLNSISIPSLFFHAHMSAEQKHKNLMRFSQEDGLVMVATSAFGMGININKVRFVVHMDLPPSIEAFYQEVGRAGRDGRQAKSLLLYGLQDILQRLQFTSLEADTAESTVADLLQLIQFLEERGCRRQALMQHFGESIESCGNCDRCLRKRDEMNVTIAAQKLLSLLHYTKGTVSISTLIAILLGKQIKAVTQVEGEKMPLFSKGRELAETDWKIVVRYLLAYKYISISQFSPLQIILESKARSILRGEEQVIVTSDFHLSRDIPVDKENQSARMKLMAWYHGLDDMEQITLKQLEKIAVHRPSNLAAISRLTGLGSEVLDKIGAELLALLKEDRLQ